MGEDGGGGSGDILDNVHIYTATQSILPSQQSKSGGYRLDREGTVD